MMIYESYPPPTPDINIREQMKEENSVGRNSKFVDLVLQNWWICAPKSNKTKENLVYLSKQVGIFVK